MKKTVQTTYHFSKTLVKEITKPEFRSLLYVIIFLLGIGTVAYRYLEGWSFLDSLFFSIDVLSTVGLGDLVPQSTGGKVFTMFYILIGVGILFSFISMIAKEARLFTTRNSRSSEERDLDNQ